MDLVVISALLSAILAILGYIAKRLDSSLKQIEKNLLLSNERHEITDIAISSLLKDSFNSKAIAEGKLPWPRIFEGPKGPVRDS